MGLFSNRKEIIVNNICPKCNMEFSDSQRTLRHMKKAHKPNKKFECNSCSGWLFNVIRTQILVNFMSNYESEKNICKNCGHKLQSHLKENGGKCHGDLNEDSNYLWCISNCRKFWD